MSILQFFQQCCDTQDYLYYGQLCAAGNCYEPLRPAGALYWFSIPYRLGWPPEILIVLHWILLIASIALVTITGIQWVKKNGGSLSRTAWIALAIASLAIHLFFFRPVLYHALTDAPAGLLLLIGIWLFILGQLKNSGALYLIAGICLGLSVWMRSFYLYPVLGFVLATTLIAIISHRSHWKKLALLVALLPILSQYHLVHQKHGYYAFLNKEKSAYWTQHHLISRFVGHDSNLSTKSAYGWAAACAMKAHSMLDVWQNKDMEGFLCLVKERTRFYWGSYLPTSYLVPPPGFQPSVNHLTHYEQLENLWVWWRNNTTVEANAAQDPYGNPGADKVIIQQASFHGATGGIYQSTIYPPLKTVPHHFSVWLWSEQPLSISMAVFTNSNVLVTRREIELTSQPIRYELPFTPPEEVLYFIGLGALDGARVSFGRNEQDAFYAWGAQITESPEMLPYAADPKLNEQRIWSKLLLLCNGLAVISAVLVLLLSTRSPPLPDRLLLITFFASIYGLSLLIIPEQRFVVAFLVFCWQITLIGAVLLLNPGKNSSHA